MLTFAIFGIHNSALRLAVELVILFLVVIWLALIYSAGQVRSPYAALWARLWR